jgi:quercetin dioxygenase-like cupin family protein
VQVIKNKIDNFDTLYIKALADCPTYKEDIKSDKTLNRMILPEGLVPRFAMGSVETEGPDEVGEHDHPMLDQIFFGLKGCKCSCFANGEETVLTENMMLHIPLASKHYVSVAEGDKLAYIWMDFFLTLEGEKYMGEQHQVEEE